jgi:hypothetical protein
MDFSNIESQRLEEALSKWEKLLWGQHGRLRRHHLV